MSVAASLNAIQVHPVLVAALPGDNSVTVILVTNLVTSGDI